MRSIHPFRRLGLRTRLTLMFALGAAGLSIVLSTITWGLTRENLLKQKEESATAEVISTRITVRNGSAPP
jgi:hypothetical protein